MTAQEARTIADNVFTPFEAVIEAVKRQSNEGLCYTYQTINPETIDKLISLGYTITPTSQPKESRISW